MELLDAQRIPVGPWGWFWALYVEGHPVLLLVLLAGNLIPLGVWLIETSSNGRRWS